MKKHYVLGSLAAVVCWSGLLWAQQPPGKTAPTPQPPGKTATTTQPPAKTTTPPEKTPPAKTSPTKSSAITEMLVTYTFDGVRIEGDYYPPPEGKMKNAPCLILLHAVGPKHLAASRADFGKLPERLQSLGYAVAVIDLRGYGKSKIVDSKFWNFHRARTRNTETIEGKDYASAAEMMEMLYDLTAVKIWLNKKKNNEKECNSQAVGVIGIEQSGLIALAWAANEHVDPQRLKNPPPSNNNNNNGGFGNGGFGNNNNNGFGNNNSGFGNNPKYIPHFEGEDITCVIAISTTNRLNTAVDESYIANWVNYIGARQTAVLGICGALDRDSLSFLGKAAKWSTAGNATYRNKNSGLKQIKGTSLTGAKLLTNDTLDVSKVLEDYLEEALRKPGQSRTWGQQTGSEIATQIDFSRLFTR